MPTEEQALIEDCKQLAELLKIFGPAFSPEELEKTIERMRQQLENLTHITEELSTLGDPTDRLDQCIQTMQQLSEEVSKHVRQTKHTGWKVVCFFCFTFFSDHACNLHMSVNTAFQDSG